MKYITEEKARILADIFGIITQDSKSCGYWQKGAKRHEPYLVIKQPKSKRHRNF